MEIYEDELGQSGDRILSSHITKLDVAWTVGLSHSILGTKNRLHALKLHDLL